MLGWHKETTADRISHRIAALKDELDDLQSALWPKPGRLQKIASEAQDWISERADDLNKVHLPKVQKVSLPDFDLPRMSLNDVRRHMPSVSPSVAVIAAAVVVGAGVGCVLYALTSGDKRRAAALASKGERRAAAGVVK